MPGALASALVMPISAKLSSKVDPRVLLVVGAAILAAALAMFVRLSPQTTGSDLFWPLIVRALGTVLMFLPLQLAAMGPVPKKDIAAATGLFNLTRQLGGSMGVALLTTMLSRREVFHRSVIAEKLASNGPGVLERLDVYTRAMMANGFPLDDARAKAHAMLDGIVSQQAAVMSFGDTFWATAALIVLTLPLVLLLGKPPAGAKVELGH